MLLDSGNEFRDYKAVGGLISCSNIFLCLTEALKQNKLSKST